MKGSAKVVGGGERKCEVVGGKVGGGERKLKVVEESERK